ncbi:MAG: glycogen synthase GlgA [Candidatus Eisenbacteria bacterium]|nr:glycogen synthase GlgA [Candidatus Eisenbacteria bacterium]
MKDGKLRIVITSSEMVPLAKVGGLADVIGALSQSLGRMGHEVTVFLPGFSSIPEKYRGETLLDGELEFQWGREKVTLREARLKNQGVRVILVENDNFFKRDGVYTDPSTGEEFKDNARRFLFFSVAAVEAVRILGLKPDVLHINDNQTAPVAPFLKTRFGGDPTLSNIPVLYTIHNLGYQGVYPGEVFNDFGISRDLFYPMGPFEFFGNVNFMKAGIWYSDLISTVSKRYAEEIQTSEEFGYGLQGVLKARSADVYGIVNGVDYSIWDPRNDKLIPVNYGKDTLEDKKKNKSALLKRCGFNARQTRRFLLGMVTRLADQKGLDLIEQASTELMKLDISLVVLGTGQKKYHEFFTKLMAKYPRWIYAEFSFDDPLAHLIEAGADAFLMPSKYEPCGLNQIYSMRYGTVPIVRAVGGLYDTVKEFNEKDWSGTGFTFSDYTPEALLACVRKAFACHENPKLWRKLMLNGMSEDFSWEKAAREYLALYRKAITKKSVRENCLAGK